MMDLSQGRPKNSERRLIIDVHYRKLGCCCGENQVEVFDDDVINSIPEELLKRGVSQTYWTQSLTEFKLKAQKSHITFASFFLSIFTVIGIPVFLYRNIKKQKLFKKFTEDMNRTLFEPRGMYMKFQYMHCNMNGNTYQYPWMAIALTPEESEILKAEPYAHVFNPWTFKAEQSKMTDKVMKCYCGCTDQVATIM
jgi:hypothetical protein